MGQLRGERHCPVSVIIPANTWEMNLLRMTLHRHAGLNFPGTMAFHTVQAAFYQDWQPR